jgi:hypothetical protein
VAKANLDIGVPRDCAQPPERTHKLVFTDSVVINVLLQTTLTLVQTNPSMIGRKENQACTQTLEKFVPGGA